MRYILLFLIVCSLGASAQTTYDYAVRDGQTLRLDLYKPQTASKNTCIVYVFGGGFVTGSRVKADNVAFFNDLALRGYTVVAIDYRLGLKGVDKVGALNHKPAFNAVRLATEDLISATAYLIENREALGIDTSRIVAMGSSAGAITVLQADYQMARRSASTEVLPSDFRFAGVVSLAGAVFSTHGRPKYVTKPAPTLFFHGTADKVVVYKKIQILNIGMFGTDALVRIFEKNDYPYAAIRYEDCGHEVAEFPRHYATDQICSIVDLMADKEFDNQIDVTIRDRYVLGEYKLDLKLKDLYNGN